MTFSELLHKRKVAILVGHYNKDSGAVDPPDALEHDEIDTREVELNYELAKALYSMIVLTGGYAVLLGGSLQERSNQANGWRSDVAISLHTNSAGPRAHGSEFLYASVHSKANECLRLATLLNQADERYLPYMKERGVKVRNGLYVLRHVHCPVVMAEVGFITNPEQERLLWDPRFHLRWACAMTTALHEFFREA
jgi:N-acetylmuramoyl-L-alanine amidase